MLTTQFEVRRYWGFHPHAFIPLDGDTFDRKDWEKADAIVKARMHFAGNPVWDRLVPRFWLEHFGDMETSKLREHCWNLSIPVYKNSHRSYMISMLVEYFINLTGGNNS